MVFSCILAHVNQSTCLVLHQSPHDNWELSQLPLGSWGWILMLSLIWEKCTQEKSLIPSISYSFLFSACAACLCQASDVGKLLTHWCMFMNADNMWMTLCKYFRLKEPKQTEPQTLGHLILGGALPSPSKEAVFHTGYYVSSSLMPTHPHSLFQIFNSHDLFIIADRP